MTNAYTATRTSTSSSPATAPPNAMTSLRLSTGPVGSVPTGGSTSCGTSGVGVVASAYGAGSRSGTFVVGCSVSGTGGGSWVGPGGGSCGQSRSGTLVVGCSVTGSCSNSVGSGPGRGSGSGARWDPTRSVPGASNGSGGVGGSPGGSCAVWENVASAGVRCSVHSAPSQYRSPAEFSGSGYQPAGVGGVVIEWVPSRRAP